MSYRIILTVVSAFAAFFTQPGVVCAADPELVTWGGYADLHIAHDFNDLPTRYRYYTTQPYYTDEPALNLSFVDAKLQSDRYQGRVALQYGSSVIANYSAEPEVLARYVQEANIGVRITDELDLAAGVFLSHLGLESWISGDNLVPSRALVSDYSPYYQSGVRARYQASERLRFEGHLLRGWQNISAEKSPSGGTKLEYTYSTEWSIAHNTFFGHEGGGKRVFNDFVLHWRREQDFGVDATYDFGIQGREDNAAAMWYGWAVIPHYRFSDTIRGALRIEQFTDNHQVLVQSESGGGFNTVSFSVSMDFDIAAKATLRAEYRAFVSNRDLFPRGEESASAADSFALISAVFRP
jgi:hypothetical protein